MLRRPTEEAEGHLLSAAPPLLYRAVKLNIRAGRWLRALELAQGAKGAHVDTVLCYRARHLAAAGVGESLPAFAAASAAQPTALGDWPAVRARKEAEKAREASRPGARALPLVVALALGGSGAGGGEGDGR